MRRGFLIGLLLVGVAGASAPVAGAARFVDVDTAPALERFRLGDRLRGLPPEYVSPGDVNGDGAPDHAFLVDGPRVRVIFGGTSRGFDVVADWVLNGLTAVGDVDGDGRDDLGVAGDEGQIVVYGRSHGGTVDVGALGSAGFVVDVGETAFALASQGPIGLGDRTGDERAELAVATDAGVMVIRSGSVVRDGVLDDEAGATSVVRAPAGSRTIGLWAASDLDGDRRRDLVFSWMDDSWSSGHLTGVIVPAAGGEETVDQVIERGAAWDILAHGPVYRSETAVLDDLSGDGRPDYVLDVEDANGSVQRRVLHGPAPGTRVAASAVPGFVPPDSMRADVGDLDGDGRTDTGGVGRILLSTSATLRGEWSWQSIYEISTRAEPSYGVWVLGTTADRDGDGRRDVVTVTPDSFDGPVRVVVLGSAMLRSLPDTNGSPEAWGEFSRPAPSPAPPWPGGVVEPPGAGTPTRGTPSELSATPEYRAGVVTLKVRAARGSRIEATGTVAPWRGGAPTAVPPAAGPADLTRPWVRVPVTLPAAARAALERDGRLRVAMSTSSISRVGWVTRRAFEFVVVARRPAPAVARRRTLRGTFGVQRLLGSGAAELLSGASGNDVLRAGAGADLLRGGTGNDTLLGQGGTDVLDGDDGDDRLYGGPGRDDLVEDRFGDDRLEGGEGDDLLYAGRGEDALFGGPGDDVLAGGSGPDIVNCGTGEDVVFVNFNRERTHLTGCEHVWEEPGVVHVPCADGGSDAPETVLGTEGDDVCAGLGGNDDLEGRGGDDRLDGGAGNDRMFGRFGADALRGEDGADELEGGRGRDVLDGGAGDDRLNGGYDPDVVRGGAGADRVVARGGGTDRIDCGSGADVAVVDSRDIVRGCERVDRSRSSAAATSR